MAAWLAGFCYDSRVYEQTYWRGVPIWQCPLDLWVYQEIICETRPEIILETGTAYGGSALYFANLFDVLGQGRVVSVDIEPQANLPVHPRIRYLRDNSLAPAILEAIRQEVDGKSRVMVMLDSDHRKDHVLAELRAYSGFVTPGSYLVVEDTNLNGHPVVPEMGPGPMEAVKEFLSQSPRPPFTVDQSREKYFLSFMPGGFLRRDALSFDGAQAGKAQHWSKSYVMLNTKAPAARQLTIEKTGDISDVAAVLMAEVDGAAYERQGTNACNATVIDPGNSLGARLEPAGLLTGVIGAKAAGSETVNGVAAGHYTFDERAFGLLGMAKSTGAMWVASQGGYLVKYALTTQADASYFGEDIEGTLTWDYELTGADQPTTIQLPKDCPAGMVNVSQLPDASNVQNVPGLLRYDTASSLAAAAFYQKQIPGLGWPLLGEPVITDRTVLLDYAQGDKKLSVVITAGNGGTNVHIILGSAQA